MGFGADLPIPPLYGTGVCPPTCFGSVERDSFVMVLITGSVKFPVVLGDEWGLCLFKIQNIDEIDIYYHF